MSETEGRPERANAWIELNAEEVAEILRPLTAVNPADLQLQPLAGLTNTSYRVEHPGGVILLRLLTGGLDGYLKEFNVLTRIAGRLPLAKPLMFSLGCEASQFVPYALHEWLEGETLQQLLARSPQHTSAAAEAVGAALSRFKQVRFHQAGFVSPLLTVVRPFEMSPEECLSDLHRLLAESPAGRRLGRLCDPIWEFAEKNAACLNDVPREFNLTHGDCHMNNILVQARGAAVEVVGFLDWEHAFSWTSLFDLAQLLDSNYPQLQEFETGVLNAFERDGGFVPVCWQSLKRLLQLVSWCEFLARGDDAPAMKKYAQERVRAILA